MGLLSKLKKLGKSILSGIGKVFKPVLKPFTKVLSNKWVQKALLAVTLVTGIGAVMTTMVPGSGLTGFLKTAGKMLLEKAKTMVRTPIDLVTKGAEGLGKLTNSQTLTDFAKTLRGGTNKFFGANTSVFDSLTETTGDITGDLRAASEAPLRINPETGTLTAPGPYAPGEAPAGPFRTGATLPAPSPSGVPPHIRPNRPADIAPFGGQRRAYESLITPQPPPAPVGVPPMPVESPGGLSPGGLSPVGVPPMRVESPGGLFTRAGSPAASVSAGAPSLPALGGMKMTETKAPGDFFARMLKRVDDAATWVDKHKESTKVFADFLAAGLADEEGEYAGYAREQDKALRRRDALFADWRAPTMSSERMGYFTQGLNQANQQLRDDARAAMPMYGYQAGAQ